MQRRAFIALLLIFFLPLVNPGRADSTKAEDFTISLDRDFVILGPGESQIIILTINNTLSEKETFSIDFSTEIKRLTVNPNAAEVDINASKEFEVGVEVGADRYFPKEKKGNITFTVTAKGQDITKELNLTVSITVSRGLEVNWDNGEKTTEQKNYPGALVSIPLTIINSGNTDEIADLRSGANLTNDEGKEQLESYTSGTVYSHTNETTTTEVRVKVPLEAPIPSQVDLKVNVSIRESNLSFELEALINIKADHRLEMSNVTPTRINIEPGMTDSFEVLINSWVNESVTASPMLTMLGQDGSRLDTLTGTGWSHRLIPSNVSLSPKGSEMMLLEVTSPNNEFLSQNGMVQANLSFEVELFWHFSAEENGTFKQEKTLNFKAQLDISLEPLIVPEYLTPASVSMVPGETASVTLKVTNLHTYNMNFSLEAESEMDITTDFIWEGASIKTATIYAGESMYIATRFGVDNNTMAGNYILSVRLSLESVNFTYVSQCEVHINQTFGFSIITENRTYKVTPRGRTNGSIIIMNTGNGDDIFELRTTISSSNRLTFHREAVNLNAGNFTEVNFTIQGADYPQHLHEILRFVVMSRNSMEWTDVFELNVTYQFPNLFIKRLNITEPEKGKGRVTIGNNGNVSASGIMVRIIFEGGSETNYTISEEIRPRGENTMNFSHKPREGKNKVLVLVDYGNLIPEEDETDNQASVDFIYKKKKDESFILEDFLVEYKEEIFGIGIGLIILGTYTFIMVFSFRRNIKKRRR